MVSEDVQKFAHPDDVAAMQAEWGQVCAEQEFLKAQQGSSAFLQGVQNDLLSFPTLNQFTAPVAGLPRLPPIDPNQYYHPHPSVFLQAPLESPAWSQPEHDGGLYNRPDFYQNYYPHIVDLELLGAVDPRAYGPLPPLSQEHLQTGMSIPWATEHTGYTYPGVIVDTMTNGDNLEPSSFAPDMTPCAKPPKRKASYTFIYEDGSLSSPPAPTTRKRRCLDEDEDEIREGKFGVYRLADASAIVMAVPVHDPQPVDISSRRTHDARGNLLRTRRFRVMELDDSYSKRSVKITNELPAGVSCVQACSWTDQPCGLFVEMHKIRVANHLWHWHGVKPKTTAPCKFEGCSDTEAMFTLVRHIEVVHYTASFECTYCGQRCSRSDSLDRHQRRCDPLLASKARAKGGRKFSPKVQKKLIYEYIAPAHDAK